MVRSLGAGRTNLYADPFGTEPAALRLHVEVVGVVLNLLGFTARPARLHERNGMVLDRRAAVLAKARARPVSGAATGPTALERSRIRDTVDERVACDLRSLRHADDRIAVAHHRSRLQWCEQGGPFRRAGRRCTGRTGRRGYLLAGWRLHRQIGR